MIEAGRLLGKFHRGSDGPLVGLGGKDFRVVRNISGFYPVSAAGFGVELEQPGLGLLDELPGFLNGGFGHWLMLLSRQRRTNQDSTADECDRTPRQHLGAT